MIATLIGGFLAVGLAGAGGAASAAGALAGLTVGAFVTCLWLLVTAGLDVLARERTPPGRLRWTIGSVLVAVGVSLLALAAGSVAASG